MYPSRFIEVDHRRDLQHGGKDTPETSDHRKACHFTSPFPLLVVGRRIFAYQRHDVRFRIPRSNGTRGVEP